MTWRQLYFSPRGRLNRGRYWLVSLSTSAVIVLSMVPLSVMSDGFTDDISTDTDKKIGLIFMIIAAGVVTVVMVLCHIFAQIKRFHDRDKSWPWFLIGFIPYIGGLWVLVECGILKGTVGPNRYGPDPLHPDAGFADVFGETATVQQMAPSTQQQGNLLS